MTVCPLVLGTRLPGGPLDPAPPAVHWLDPDLARHRDTPWLARYLRDRHGLALPAPDLNIISTPPTRTVEIDPGVLAKHALVIGATGSGKTRAVLYLLRAQLQAGCSAVVIDFKPDTAREAVALAREAGVREEDIALLWTGEAGQGVPGWNPFAVPLGQVSQAVRAFKDIFANAYRDSWGARLDDLLENAATVVAGQGLSPLELVRFLQSEEYRNGLLFHASGSPAWERYPEEHAYFTTEFAGMGASGRNAAIGPVLNKVRKLVTTPYLRALLCAREDTLRLETLWQRQRVLVVHLEQDALGADGTRLLSGLLAHRLYALCMHRPGPVPVQLVLDELGPQERFLGAAIRDIVERGRQQGLWLLTAGQHLGQISEELRALLLSNTGLQMFLRLGMDDAKRVAAFLATGMGERTARIALGSVQAHGATEYETAWLPVVDSGGKPLSVLPGEYGRMARLCGPPLGTRLAAWAEWIGQRAYVALPGGATREVRRFLAEGYAYATVLASPRPLRLALRFPRPKVSVEEKESEAVRANALAGLLASLRERQAVMRTSDGLRAHLQVAAMPFPARLPDAASLLRGQDADAVARTYRARMQEIARLSGGETGGGNPFSGPPGGSEPDVPRLREEAPLRRSAPERPQGSDSRRRATQANAKTGSGETAAQGAVKAAPVQRTASQGRAGSGRGAQTRAGANSAGMPSVETRPAAHGDGSARAGAAEPNGASAPLLPNVPATLEVGSDGSL